MKAYGRNEYMGYHNINGGTKYPDKLDMMCLGLPGANMSKNKTRRKQKKYARHLAKEQIRLALVE